MQLKLRFQWNFKNARIAMPLPAGPPAEDQSGRSTQFLTFIIYPTGLFRTDAPVAQLFGSSTSSHGCQDRVVKYKYFKASSKAVESGAFPLLYLCKDVPEPFDMSTQVKNKFRRRASSRSGGAQNQAAWELQMFAKFSHSHGLNTANVACIPTKFC